jgi:hypothetical protein
MYHAELLRSAAALPQRHSARMFLRPEQQFHIAAVYDKAAFDISLPAHTRAAFARKADWFRLLARVGEKKESLSRHKAREANPNPFGFIGSRHSRLDFLSPMMRSCCGCRRCRTVKRGNTAWLGNTAGWGMMHYRRIVNSQCGQWAHGYDEKEQAHLTLPSFGAEITTAQYHPRPGFPWLKGHTRLQKA